jgi:hypothetical protein
MADATTSGDSSASLAQMLSGLFSGAYGASQLFGSGAGSAAGSAAAGAAAANPFAGQNAQYQPALSASLTGQQSLNNNVAGSMSSILNQLLGSAGSVQGSSSLTSMLQGLAGQQTALAPGATSTAVSGPGAAQLGSAQSLQDQTTALAGNYMDNPAIKAQYQLGLDTVNRGAAANGTTGTGGAMAQLEQYGQTFASNAYQQQYTDILNTNQQEFGQNSTNTSQTQAAQNSSFGNASTLTQLQAALQGQQFNQGLNLNQQLAGFQSANAGILSSAASAENGFGSTLLNGQQGITNSLLSASGATTGSPGTAGTILSGQFGNSQTAAGNLGSGITGIASSIGSLLNGSGAGSGISSYLSSLFGSGGATGSEAAGAVASSTPDDLISSFVDF